MSAIVLRNGSGLTVELLANGAIGAIRHADVLVNQVLGSPIEGGIGNLYVRRLRRGAIVSFPVLGPAAPGRFRASSDGAAWEGSVEGLEYACTLRLAPDEPSWFWSLRLVNTTRRSMRVDALLAQDLGLAHEAAVRTNELYTSQYLDHAILDDATFGPLVCSRQNLPQGDAFPWLVHGCLDGAAGYLTDGFQFHGLDFRATGRPVALDRPRLPNRVYQYEFALPTVQSRPLALAAGASGELAFFAAFVPDHPAATAPADAERAHAAAAAFRALPTLDFSGLSAAAPRSPGRFDDPPLFESHDLDRAGLERFFGTGWRHVEEREGRLLSFFHGTGRHVVLKAKELRSERPTGHVMRSGRDLLPSDDLLSATAWMTGVFASQLTIGNPSFNKLLGVNRNPLNVLRTSGLRILVRTERGDELLGVPSAFEMGPNGARWIYHDDRLTISIRVDVSLDDPVCRLAFDVLRGGRSPRGRVDRPDAAGSTGGASEPNDGVRPMTGSRSSSRTARISASSVALSDSGMPLR